MVDTGRRWKSIDQRAWLTHGLDFLSGYAEPRRQVIVPVQVFFDDSGGRADRVFCYAGFIGEADDWAAFSERWAECLAVPPSIKVFKMRDAVKRGGEFYGFSEEWRDNKLRDLARVIDHFGFRAMHASLEMDDFYEVMRPEFARMPVNNPHFWACERAVWASCADLLARGHAERFTLFFDDHPNFGPKLKRWYPLIRKLAAPEARAIMPLDIYFDDDEHLRPLQAADMLAWLCRRDLAKQGHPFAWLRKEVPNVSFSPYSQYITKEYMKQWIAASYDPAIQITAEEWEDDSEAFGLEDD